MFTVKGGRYNGGHIIHKISTFSPNDIFWCFPVFFGKSGLEITWNMF